MPRGPEIRSRAQKKCLRNCSSWRWTVSAHVAQAVRAVLAHGCWLLSRTWERMGAGGVGIEAPRYLRKKCRGEPCRPDLATNYSGANPTAPTRSSPPRLAVAGGLSSPKRAHASVRHRGSAWTGRTAPVHCSSSSHNGSCTHTCTEFCTNQSRSTAGRATSSNAHRFVETIKRFWNIHTA